MSKTPCREQGCHVHRSFGYIGGPRLYCDKHRKHGMVSNDNRSISYWGTCEHVGCDAERPTYGWKGWRPQFCKEHKNKGMVKIAGFNRFNFIAAVKDGLIHPPPCYYDGVGGGSSSGVSGVHIREEETDDDDDEVCDEIEEDATEEVETTGDAACEAANLKELRAGKRKAEVNDAGSMGVGDEGASLLKRGRVLASVTTAETKSTKGTNDGGGGSSSSGTLQDNLREQEPDSGNDVDDLVEKSGQDYEDAANESETPVAPTASGQKDEMAIMHEGSSAFAGTATTEKEAAETEAAGAGVLLHVDRREVQLERTLAANTVGEEEKDGDFDKEEGAEHSYKHKSSANQNKVVLGQKRSLEGDPHEEGREGKRLRAAQQWDTAHIIKMAVLMVLFITIWCMIWCCWSGVDNERVDQYMLSSAPAVYGYGPPDATDALLERSHAHGFMCVPSSEIRSSMCFLKDKAVIAADKIYTDAVPWCDGKAEDIVNIFT